MIYESNIIPLDNSDHLSLKNNVCKINLNYLVEKQDWMMPIGTMGYELESEFSKFCWANVFLKVYNYYFLNKR